MALSKTEKMAFEHITMEIFHRTPSKITEYISDDISARSYLQVPSSNDPHSLHLASRDGKLKWWFADDVKEYDRNFIENLIRNDEVVRNTFKIEQ